MTGWWRRLLYSVFCHLGLGLGVQEKESWSLDSVFLLALSVPLSKPQPHPLSTVLSFPHEALAFLVAESLEMAGNIVCTCPEVRHIIKAAARRAAFSSHLGRSPLFSSLVEACLAPLSDDCGVPACEMLYGLQRQQALLSLFGVMNQPSVFAAVVGQCQVAQVYFMSLNIRGTECRSLPVAESDGFDLCSVASV